MKTTATFVLHHPEHGHAVILPIISCLIDGTLVYTKEAHPFASFISLVSPTSEVYSFPTALLSSCGTLFLDADIRVCARSFYRMTIQSNGLWRVEKSSAF